MLTVYIDLIIYAVLDCEILLEFLYLGGHMTEVCCNQEIHENGKIT